MMKNAMYSKLLGIICHSATIAYVIAGVTDVVKRSGKLQAAALQQRQDSCRWDG